ncbi:GlsB/YeaQ/YmgE family stress response membrane protein [Streptomyces sp. NPDC021224]|uniref:GlsB/YeaQ/YmgE family stress response membrane protein n=1 Tax=unclassified Streptomyces TaxID=2593676 RepID=UPI0037B7DF95
MTILWAIIAGLIIGLLAKLVLPGRQPIPLWLTVVLGIIGGLLGNGLASAFGVADTNGVDWIRHALQIGAAAVLIGLITPLYAGRGHRHHHRF